MAHPLFTAYKRIGAVAMLEIAEKVVAHALGQRRMIETSLPRAGRATLRRQAKEKRDVLHLLHATPVLRGSIRGDNVQPIQDLVTLPDIEVSVEAKGKSEGRSGLFRKGRRSTSDRRTGAYRSQCRRSPVIRRWRSASSQLVSGLLHAPERKPET